jgi:hypothetical protein
MAQPTYEELDDFRGYGIQKMTLPVDADQEQFDKTEYIASNPRNGQTVARALTHKELTEKISALPQCYISVGDYLMELTHETGGDREIIVNFFKPNGDALLTNARLLRKSTNDEVREVLPPDVELSAPELAAVMELIRTPPISAGPKE